MSNVVLCVDIGTTSLKAGLITADGEVVSFCSIPIEEPQNTKSPDSKNEFAASLWYGAFFQAVRELKFQCVKNKLSIEPIKNIRRSRGGEYLQYLIGFIQNDAGGEIILILCKRNVAVSYGKDSNLFCNTYFFPIYV